MRVGRIVISSELLFARLGIADARLVGPTNEDGHLELTVEHPALPEVVLIEGARAPIVTAESLLCR